ncbi:MAG TPA: radical SAM protein [Burkholderiaceae bacterium]|nr:radical SAM protein [Burkholderiaceae bacterium]
MNIATVPLSAIARPRQRGAVSELHAFDSGRGRHVLVVDGSRIYDVPDGADEASLLPTLRRDERAIGDEIPLPPVNALALAITQRCNLACGYCYADGGHFGGDDEAPMSWDVARAAVERLLDNATPGSTASLAFMGGEPLLNRALLRQATEHAAALAAQRGVTMRFALTTNATLVTPDDAAFLARHRFAVTVSIDGERELHDALRPTRGGTGSYERIVARLQPLLAALPVSARVTVTPRHAALRATLDHVIGLGFHSVGFSPSLSSADPRLALSGDDLERLLAQMIGCAQEAESRWLRGERYPFSNLLAAVQELHRGTHRPLPCGAGAGYLGVAADGALSACHRFVGDPRAAMGSVAAGIDDAARKQWLATRHVDHQEPCRSCWARYLCGGGCHHEVLHRGRPACDFIRGWLDHCLGAYVRIADERPDLFD